MILVQGFDKNTVERNRVRSMLSNFFSNRQCATLVRPCSDEITLQQVDAVPFSELRTEFQEALENLRGSIFSAECIIPKCMQGRNLNGFMMSGLVESYCSAINAGGVRIIFILKPLIL